MSTATAKVPSPVTPEQSPEEREVEELEARIVAETGEEINRIATEARLGKLEGLAELFQQGAARKHGRKRQRRQFNKAIDALLDDDEPDLTPLRDLTRQAVTARAKGFLDLLDDE